MKSPIGRLAHVFEQAGFQLYLVGGPVRDRIMGRDVHDIDLTTDARPDRTKALIKRAGASDIFGVGEKFGTIGALFDGTQVEITTFRSEAYTPGSRKPQVEFGDSLEADLARRDFTINAIAQDVFIGRIVDPFGGVADIVRRVIRAVGNPDDRFREDPLRVLRAVRFAVQLGFDIAQDTAAAMRRNATGLGDISAERIGAELQLILMADGPERAIVSLLELGLLSFVLPDLIPLQRTIQDDRHQHKDVFAHTMRVLSGVSAVPELRWAALLHDVAKPETKSIRRGRVNFHGHEALGARKARDILTQLKFDGRLVERASHIVRLHMRANSYRPDWTDGAVRRFIREAGDELDNLIAFSRADITSYRPRRVERGLSRVAELQVRCETILGEQDVAALDSPLDGHALMKLFDRPPGIWIKLVKQHLLDLVLDGELDPDDVDTAERVALAFVEASEPQPATNASSS